MIKTFTSNIASTFIAAFTRIADADAAYRRAHKLQSLSDAHLTDMGLSRRDTQALMDMPTRGSRSLNHGRTVQLRRS